MNLPSESYEQIEQALDELLVQAAGEHVPAKRKIPHRKITQLTPEHAKPVKLAAPPRKVWWPASCRGIVG